MSQIATTTTRPINPTVTALRPAGRARTKSTTIPATTKNSASSA